MRWTLLLLGLVACGRPTKITQADHPAYVARATCARLSECSRGTFETTYFSMADCRDQLEQQVSDQDDAEDKAGCDYDAKQAALAYSDLLDVTCEDFYEGKYTSAEIDVWSCGIQTYTRVPGAG